MKKQLSLIFAASLLFLFAACSSSDTSAQFVGSWGSQESGQPNLAISKDLEISGTGGCNQLSASGSMVDKTLRFNNMTSTEMLCPGIDEWLLGAYGATITDDVMTIMNMDDKVIGTLNKTTDK